MHGYMFNLELMKFLSYKYKFFTAPSFYFRKLRTGSRCSFVVSYKLPLLEHQEVRIPVTLTEFCHFPKCVLVHIRIKGEVGAVKLV